MSVDRTGTVTKAISDYIDSIPEEKSKQSKVLFQDPANLNIKNIDNIFINNTEDNLINGIIVTKRIMIEKRPYVNVLLCYAETAETYNALVKALVDHEKSITSDGIFTEPFSDDDLRTSVFKKYKLKKYQSVYSIRKADLMSKVTAKPSLRWKLFERKSKSDLGSLFMKFLIEYDIFLAKKRNDVLGQPVFKTHLERSRTQRIRVSYFMESVLNSKEWTACILFDDDEPIGFVKGRIVKNTDICYPEIFLKSKYINKYRESALAILLQEIKVDYIGFMGSENETEYLSMYESLAGKPLGHSYACI